MIAMPRLPWHRQDNTQAPRHQGLGAGQLARQEHTAGQRYGAALGQQQNALDGFNALAQGQGPSLAQEQLAAGMQQNVANQMSMAAQGRGGNLAAQQRQAAAAGAGGQMALQQQMGQLRAQEQLAAMHGAAGMANQMAGQGLQAQMGYGGMLADAQGQQMGAETQWGLGQRGMDIDQRQGNRNFGLGLLQGGMGALSSIAQFSDERVKQDIGASGLAASEAVGVTPAQTYEYQPGYGEPGQRVGVMAQDLERTPAGAAIVSDTPYGKTVDVGGMSSLALAASSEQEQRIRALEQMLQGGAAPFAGGGGNLARETPQLFNLGNG